MPSITEIVVSSGFVVAFIAVSVKAYGLNREKVSLEARVNELEQKLRKETTDRTDAENGIREYYEKQVERYKTEWEIAHKAAELHFLLGFVSKEVIEEMRKVREKLNKPIDD